MRERWIKALQHANVRLAVRHRRESEQVPVVHRIHGEHQVQAVEPIGIDTA